MEKCLINPKSRTRFFYPPIPMKTKFLAHYARHKPLYDVSVSGCVWILMLMAMFCLELYLQ